MGEGYMGESVFDNNRWSSLKKGKYQMSEIVIMHDLYYLSSL